MTGLHVALNAGWLVDVVLDAIGEQMWELAPDHMRHAADLDEWGRAVTGRVWEVLQDDADAVDLAQQLIDHIADITETAIAHPEHWL